METVARLSRMVLDLFKQQYKVSSLDELLETDNAHFFSNLFAKLRYFSAGMSSKHVHLCLISLKSHAPERMEKVVLQLMELISKNIDSAMVYLD